MQDIFSLRDVSHSYGSLKVLNNVDLGIQAGEILGIAGPNGAGKSTLLNVCTGLIRPKHGTIYYDMRPINGMKPYHMCQLGIARTFQIPQVFESLTVFENVETGALFGRGRLARGHEDSVLEILDLLSITHLRSKLASSASLLTRKMIMLGAALATGPKVVFMDEPFGGLSRAEIDQYVELVARLRRELGLAFVIVEHKVRALSLLARKILILHFGSVVMCDAPDVVMRDPNIIDIYLGSSLNA